MPIVSRTQRAAALYAYDPVFFKLCVGSDVPELLRFRCNTDLPFCYGRSDAVSRIPSTWDGPDVEIVPLWEDANGIVAMRKVDGNEDFIHISLERPENPLVISHSVNGLLTYLMFFVVESHGEFEALRVEELAKFLDFSGVDVVKKLAHQLREAASYDELWQFTRSV